MKSRFWPLLLPLFCSSSSALGAARAASLAASQSSFVWAEDPLEARWSYRAQLQGSEKGANEARWLLGRDADNGVLLSIQGNEVSAPAQGVVWRLEKGKATTLATFSLPYVRGELGLIRVGRALKVLWNGEVKAQTQTDLGGARFGTQVSRGWKISNAQMQPTEPVVLRDDFMRASGPDEPEGGGVWKTVGNWKTSGTLGPLADASLSPNPFVFRAQGEGLHLARAGNWFWNNYSVSASVRAMEEGDDKTPLVAGLEAFRSSSGASVRGEIDFRTGIARIVQTPIVQTPMLGFISSGEKSPGSIPQGRTSEQVLAQSAPFDASIGEWHRMRLEPSNGSVSLLFDGREVARAKCDLAQGEVALRAQASKNAFVDFDDVRVGAPQGGQAVWGEGQLPDRLVKDRLMKNWASAASAWKRDAQGIWWHTGDFWNEANLDVPLPALKEGQGFRFYAFTSASAPQNAALVATVTRKNGKIEVSTANTVSPRAPVVFAPGQSNTLSLRLGAFKKDFRAGSLGWNGKQLFPIWARRGNGTKIGVQPLQNGAPLPPAGLQTLSLVAPTMERDGQSVIGVNITAVTPQIASDMALPDAAGIIIDHVEDGSPAKRAGFQSGDVVRAVNGSKITNIDTMRAAVGSVRAPSPVTLQILRARKDASNLDWGSLSATTSGQLDYAFTSAPTDWKAARGTWEVAERWTCSPQWSFFAGQNDEFPLLWSRFALASDWTLEAYLATPMDLTRGERSPSDLNISIGDGKNISSGYSFAFAAEDRSKNLIWRGDKIVASKPFEMPPGAGDTHQDWFYVRLERRQTARGVRFKWSVNGQSVGDYEDLNPIQAANRLAFWTKNGAVSLARVRLWHAGLKDVPVEPRSSAIQTAALPNVLGEWAPRDAGPNASARLRFVGAQSQVLEAENSCDGGDWTVYLTRKPFDPAQKNGVLSFDYRVPAGVKLNLYALVGGQWREIAWTGGASTPDSNQPTLGAIENVATDNAWHTARFDLSGAVARNGLSGNSVEALAFAAPARDYLRQGLGGNARGAKFWLRNLNTLPATLARDVSAPNSAPVR